MTKIESWQNITGFSEINGSDTLNSAKCKRMQMFKDKPKLANSLFTVFDIVSILFHLNILVNLT